MTQITTLTALNQSTDWLDLVNAPEHLALHIIITGTLTISVQVSNDGNLLNEKSDTFTVETITASAAKQYSKPLPRFMRFRITAYTNGSAVVSVWPTLGRTDLRIAVSSEPRERP